MVLSHDFEQGKSNRQFFNKSPLELPCLCRYDDPKGVVEGLVPWHWHTEIEVNYVTEGCWVFSAIDQEYELHAGDAIFVNANCLHSTHWKTGTRPGKFISLIFDADYLCGILGNLLDTKYIHPILASQALQVYVIKPIGEAGLSMAQNILNVWKLFQDEPFGYELMARNELCLFWCRLLQETESVRKNHQSINPAGNVIKPMLEFIHSNYMDKISLEHIAGAGAVSTRECNRVFHKYIHATPMDYVNTYRVRMAAHALLQNEKSIAQIAEDTGFSSTSYMAKVFRKIYDCTPMEYRSKNRNGLE